MAREVNGVYEVREEHKYRLSKDRTFVTCDDGAVYEFVQPDGAPRPRFRRSFDPDGTVKNQSGRKVLASAVEETVDTLFEGWEK
jgi:hypothetical protein